MIQKNSYNPFKAGSEYFKPATGEEKEKAKQVISEINNIKDELVKLDNKPGDHDRKRGSIELLSKKLDTGNRYALGSVEFDDYTEEHKLLGMNLGISENKDCQEGTFVVDESGKHYSYIDISNDDGIVETEIFNKHDRRTGCFQTVHRDVETGSVMYREEKR